MAHPLLLPWVPEMKSRAGPHCSPWKGCLSKTSAHSCRLERPAQRCTSEPQPHLQHQQGMSSQCGSIALHCTGVAAGRRLPCSQGQATEQALGKQPVAIRRQAARYAVKMSVCRAHFCRGEGVATLDLISILKGPGVCGVPCAAASVAAAGAGDGCEGGRAASLTLCKAPAANTMSQVYMASAECRICLLHIVIHLLQQLLGLARPAKEALAPLLSSARPS